ncbi:MAG: rhodanese-like domain-containing protein [Limisphaerales bacterium]
MTTTETIGPQSPMRQVLELFPGAQRALFRAYHIGGCSSCGFQPEETLEQLCRRNNNLDVTEVIEHIQASHEQDAKIFIAPKDLAELLERDKTVKLLDVRSREEYEAVHLDGALLMAQATMQEIMGHWPRTQVFVVVDHQGKQALDAAAYFLGHGFEGVRCLRGGIDAWSQEVDPKIRRYRLG